MARYGLPEEVKFCNKCVISNQRPSSTVEFQARVDEQKSTISFDSDGMCDACLFAQEKDQIDWSEREQQLLRLSEKLDSHPGYNILVPGSGGKDSAFTAHVLKYKYGFRPLTVTWAPHLYTEIGRRNFDSWIHEGGLDNLLLTPNGRLHRHLTSLAFKNLLHPFQPFIVGQRIIGPRFAAQLGIPVVFYGENQAEYGNSREENKSPTMKREFFSFTSDSEPKFGGVPMSQILADGDFVPADFLPYLPPSQKEIESSGVQVHYLGYYLKWDPQECFYYAVDHTGFEPSPVRTEGSYSKYSSLDDKVDPFHYYTTLAKFGLGRASYDAAQEIRNGKITRDEGVALVKKFDQEFPSLYFAEFLDYIDISEGEFHKTVDAFRSPHLWRKSSSGNWELKTPVWDYAL
jgi:N-acetyl sugar amidotransferase